MSDFSIKLILHPVFSLSSPIIGLRQIVQNGRHFCLPIQQWNRSKIVVFFHLLVRSVNVANKRSSCIKFFGCYGRKTKFNLHKEAAYHTETEDNVVVLLTLPISNQQMFLPNPQLESVSLHLHLYSLKCKFYEHLRMSWEWNAG